MTNKRICAAGEVDDGLRPCGSGSLEAVSPQVESSDSPRLYIYTPLKPTKEIRVLLLQPGTFQDPIRANIEIVSLSHDPIFDAVSYCWANEDGDDVKRCEAFIIGPGSRETVICITRNCEAALRHVRKTDRVMRLWVDAICIDQDHGDEKNHQVDLMPLIYSHAGTTYVFLGEGDAEASSVLAELSDQSWMSTDILWKHIFGRRYFTRVWVLQEIAMSNDLKVILGSTEVTWSSIFAWHKLGGIFMSVGHQRIPNLLQLRSDTQFRGSASLQQALRLGRSSQAANAEDKVFALLGMVDPQQRLGLYADYESGARDVYLRVAKRLIDLDGGSLRSVLGSIICNMAGSPDDDSIKAYDLPSWVPDWRQPISSEPSKPGEWLGNDSTRAHDLSSWDPDQGPDPFPVRWRRYEVDFEERFPKDFYGSKETPININIGWYGDVDSSTLILEGDFLGDLNELFHGFECRVWLFDVMHPTSWMRPSLSKSGKLNREAETVVAFRVVGSEAGSGATHALVLRNVDKKAWLRTEISGPNHSDFHGPIFNPHGIAVVSTSWARHDADMSGDLLSPEKVEVSSASDVAGPTRMADGRYNHPKESRWDEANFPYHPTGPVRAGRKFKLLGVLVIEGPDIWTSGADGQTRNLSRVTII